MRLFVLSLLLCLSAALHAQMWTGTDTLYGNEWINYNLTYYKIKVADDGLYRLPAAALAGTPLASVPASQFRLYHNGQQTPVFTSTDGVFGPQDFLEFFGEKNKGEVDRFLFENPDNQAINPAYSMFNDTAAYFLCLENTTPALRYDTPTNDLSNLPTAEPFCWYTLEQLFNAASYKRKIADEITFSWFDGNGFCRSGSTSSSFSFSPVKIAPNAPVGQVSIRYGTSIGQHAQQLYIGDSLALTDEFYDPRIFQHDIPLKPGWLQAPTVVKMQSTLGGTDRHFVSFVRLRYARQFDFENSAYVLFEIEGNNAAQYLEIQNFIANQGAPMLLDLSNNLRLEAIVNGNTLRFKLPPASGTRMLALVSPGTGVKTVSTLKPVQFTSFALENANFLIISNKKLFSDPAAGGANWVDAYRQYRTGAAGGGHRVTVADVEDLYDQFAYGIRFHPLALRNFIHYASLHWDDLAHTLLIGKALDYPTFRQSTVQNTLADSLFFVPTFGTPGADQLFAYSGNRLQEPVTAVGRLAVTEPQEIKAYLDKVITYEQAPITAGQNLAGKAWMKRVIHNSGGLSGESGLIRNYITDMAGVLRENKFGADIYTYYKTSNDPIQLSSYEQMLHLIDDGVSVWTIFGHSSSTAVDFDIGSPEVYHNQGRYPFMMVLGCFSGICSSPQQGIGEQFVLAPDRGAIAYIASVHFSFIDALHLYGREYYHLLGEDDYGKSIGTVLRHTTANLSQTNNERLIAVLHQNLLQGDPAIHLPAFDGPDYLIDNATVQFDPNPVSLEQSTVKLSFDVANIGANTGGQLPLHIEQRLPDNQTVLSRLRDTIGVPANRATLQYALPLTGSQVGLNRYFIRLDEGNVVLEAPPAAELNNTLTDATGAPGVEVFFFANDVTPVYPPDFGIFPAQPLHLYASTLNPLAAPGHYLWAVDTLESFDSPALKTGEIMTSGGLLHWEPNIPLRDSTVYYWRVARDSLVNGEIPWRTRSFLVLNSNGQAGGWNQSHFGQWIRNTPVNVQWPDTSRQLAFLDNAGYLNVQVGYRGINANVGMQNNFYQGFFGDPGWIERNIAQGVALMLVDPNTGKVALNPANGPYNTTPGKENLLYYFDTKDSLQRIALMQFIENQIPTGYYVGLLGLNYTFDPIGYAPQRWALDSVTYGKNLFQVLEAQGAQKVRQTAVFSGIPPAYGLVFQKNTPSFTATDTLNTSTAPVVLSIRRNYFTKWSSGFWESPPIDKAKAWKALHWRREAHDNQSDKAELSLLAVRPGVPDTLLMTLVGVFDTVLTGMSTQDYPQLKVRYTVLDTLAGTPTPIRYVRLLYDETPEGVVHPGLSFDFHADTLQEGEDLRLSVPFINVTPTGMDSVLVRYVLENENGRTRAGTIRQAPLPGKDTLLVAFQLNTKQLSGKNRLLLEVNPDNDQPEQVHVNNLLARDCYVTQDSRNPLLDVTFDGAHIIDGEIVSPKPLIIMQLRDDNRYLAITDTTAFSLTLEHPDGSTTPVYYSDPAILFIPADPAQLPQKNTARLEWRPFFEQDGTYRLLVNGRDATGNAAGKVSYSVTFEVINKSSISRVLNYPNPFSTSTCFVYTMTGAEPPVSFRLQIMTVSGRVVREVTEAEFGSLQAGTHFSDFCWDGRDQFGDQLANGVYLYRISAKKADGTDFDLFENRDIDGYFKHGFGKMVLMR